MTHPVLLWARTLSSSPNAEAKKIAAFKLSHYSQKIFQAEAVTALLNCVKGGQFSLRVLCTKALGRAGNQSQNDHIRSTLMEVFDSEPKLRSSVIRAVTIRKDSAPHIADKFLTFAKEATEPEEQVTALSYFEACGSSSPKLIPTLAEIYQKSTNSKVKRSVAQTLAEQGRGQDQVIDILSQCGGSKEDTPLILICLGGLQQQGKTDVRTWGAVEKAVESSDLDVQLAVVDLIEALPPTPNPKVTEKLLALIDDAEDDDLLEKMVLSLGVVGDGSEKIVEALNKVLENTENSEGTRIAAALTISKQASSEEKSNQGLSKCANEDKSETVKSACELGVREIASKIRIPEAPKNPVPSVSPSPSK